MIGKRTRFAAVVAAVVAMAGCGGKGQGGPGGAGGFQMPPTPVETAKVVAGPVSDAFSTVGTLEAAEQVALVSEIDGTVVRVPFREGDPIGKGGIVAQLDDESLEAEFRRAEALRDQRHATFNRVKQVVDAKAGAPQDLDDAEAALRVADAEATLAKVRLSKTRIAAPFAGVIGPRAVSPGAFVRAGDVIAEMAQITEMKVSFSMPERYLADVDRGASVTLTTTTYPQDPFVGRVDVVDPIVDPATRNVRVIARLANPGGRLRPGMSAHVDVILSTRESALTVPAQAVVGEGNEFLVYKVQEDGTVARTTVTLGTRLADAVEIVSGLAEGDIVVTAGQQKLYPGAKVMPMGADGAPAGPGGPGGPGGPPEGGAAPGGDAPGAGAAAGASPESTAAEGAVTP